MRTKFGHQDVLFGLLMLSIIFTGADVLSEFKQLPGPVYGGDLYLHFGIVNHIIEGGSPVMSSHFLSEYEHYPWLMHLLIVVFSAVGGLSPLKAMIYFPIFISLGAALVAYLLGNKVFKSKEVGLVMALLWTLATGVPGAVPTHFSNAVLIPLIPLALYRSRTRKGKIVSGVAYGLCGVGHIVAFLAANLFLGLSSVADILGSHLRFKKSSLRIVNLSSIRKSVNDSFVNVATVVIIGLPLALLYWAPPIFIYHAKTLNPWQEYVSTGLAGLTGSYVWGQMKGVFFSFGSFNAALLSTLAVLGLLYSLKKDKAPLLVFLTGFLGVIHPWITKPLFGTSFGFYGFPIILNLSRSLFVVGGLAFITERARGMFQKRIILLVFALFLIYSNYSIISEYKKNPWTQVGMEMPPATEALFEIGEWVKSETGKDEVFITTHDESAFALNGLSGAKIVSMRRTHASPYVNVNERVADKAVMLYGKNEETVKGLIDRYAVKYLYEDLYSAEAQMRCDQVFDALKNPQYGDLAFNCLTTDPEYEDYLRENGVEFVQTNMRLDPSDARAPRFDMLAIKPTGINSYLAGHTKKVKEATIEGQPIAVILQIA